MTGLADIAVVGGGLTGSALAYGLTKRGASVVMFDPQEDDLHASAGNFGLVWLQGKGLGAPAYADLTRRSVDAWGEFSAELEETTGVATSYSQSGGVKIALSEAELDDQRDALRRMHNQSGSEETSLLTADELRELVPAVGPDAVGGVWCPLDGHADPLGTHRALRIAISASGRGRVRRGFVQRIERDGSGFALTDEAGSTRAGKVVIAAGLGSGGIAGNLGLSVPLKPQRGQILVTERRAPFLKVACHTVRQTETGTVLIGDSKEDVGFDRGATPSVAAKMAERASRMFPILRGARVVRQWAALRVMSPDGLPIYAQSEKDPGAMLLTCHSGVTLAAAHAGEVADAVLSGALGSRYSAFSPDRFAAAA